MMRRSVTCDDLERLGMTPGGGGGHCWSCHNEWADGYGEPTDYEYKYSDGLVIAVFTCCGYSELSSDLSEEQQARLRQWIEDQ